MVEADIPTMTVSISIDGDMSQSSVAAWGILVEACDEKNGMRWQVDGTDCGDPFRWELSLLSRTQRGVCHRGSDIQTRGAPGTGGNRSYRLKAINNQADKPGSGGGISTSFIRRQQWYDNCDPGDFPTTGLWGHTHGEGNPRR